MLAIKEKISLDSFQLKLIAIFIMTVDHIGASLFPKAMIGELPYLRIIGRLAFPIFCFLIVEGFYHTRNVKKYIGRLLLFALISELPYDLLFNDSANILAIQNIFFTLSLGLITIYVCELIKKKWGEGSTATAGMQVGVIMLAVALGFLGNFDYGGLGIVYILVFYLYRGNNVLLFIILAVVNLLFYEPTNIQTFSVLAVPIVSLYNGKRGRSMKYFFYAYYPLHLTILAAIYYYLHGFIPANWLPF